MPPLRNLTRHWLTSHLPGAKQGEVKGDRGSAPARKISFVSLVVYGPKVSHSALAMGVYSFCNQAGRFPTLTFMHLIFHHKCCCIDRVSPFFFTAWRRTISKMKVCALSPKDLREIQV